ncbi:MAG: FAD-dependent oxidoreductase, partial [Gammaproteobacteria bacterium]|nr:FAD-dependent oxidoreductase [Gammaproteobacteria bacterium]
MTRQSVAIIGAGMAGLCMAIRLREAGYQEIAIYEKADSAGGTWRENTYPGVSCDVPSHLYSYSF